MGEERWWELSGTPMLDDKHKFLGFRGVGSDITEKRKSSEKIAYLARFDTLTSLPNRLPLTEALSAALDYADRWRTRSALLQIGRAHVRTPITNAHLVCSILLEKKKNK